MPALRRYVTLDRSPGVGPWISLGHNRPPPAVPREFGPSIYTAAEQAKNPGLPMTRVVKDVLPVGRVKIGTHGDGSPEFWDVTPQVLAHIASAHERSFARGVAMNLTKSHGNLATGIVPTDELIAPIHEAIVSGGVLWISCYVTPEQARYLQNPACKVSPGIWPNWSDGLGNVYPIRMLHVAVTDNPTVPGQGRFIAMANRVKPFGVIALANASAPAEPHTKATAVDFNELKSQIDILLTELSQNGPTVKLPTDVTEETINRDLRTIINSMGLTPLSSDQRRDDTGYGPDLSPLTMANRYREAPRRKPASHPMTLSNARHSGRPTDAQCRDAARKFYGGK